MIFKRSFLFFVSLFFSCTLTSQTIVELPATGNSEHLAKHAWILEDVKDELNLANVIKKNSLNDIEGAFQSKLDIPYMDFTSSAFWMELNIRNSEEVKKRFIIELARPLTNQVDLYLINEENEIVKEFHTGDDFIFEQRAYKYRKFVFPLEFDPLSNYRILVRAKSDGEILKLPMKFWSTEGFTEFVSKENFFLGMYYGFIFLVVLLFTFFGIALRDKIYFFFVSYVFVMGLFQISLDGFGFRFLSPNSTYFGNHSILIFVAVALLCLMTYANQFLELYKEKKWFTVLYNFFYLLVFLLLITSFSEGWLYKITFPLVNVISFIIFSLILLGIYLRHKSGNKTRIEVTLAFVFICIGAIVFILANINIIESEFLAENSFKIASGIEIILLSLSLASRNRETQNDKLTAERKSLDRFVQIRQLKSEQTDTLEREVKLRTQEVVYKNDLLEKQNKEIIQSINYARKLQGAILPSKKLLAANFLDFDLYFKPKDIVSGDFYWLESNEQYCFFAVVDCTGHGVPGALLSVAGHNELNKCVNELKLTDPGEILDRLTILIEHTFDNDNSADSAFSDGMDICLCRWDYKNELVYSGAFNPLYLLRNNEFEEVKADRQPIGKFIKRAPFTSTKIEVAHGDQIFLFSDGYQDQFGGVRGKKLRSKGFKKHLLSAVAKKEISFTEQLDMQFKEWTQNEEQIDDICVLRVGF